MNEKDPKNRMDFASVLGGLYSQWSVEEDAEKRENIASEFVDVLCTAWIKFNKANPTGSETNES